MIIIEIILVVLFVIFIAVGGGMFLGAGGGFDVKNINWAAITVMDVVQKDPLVETVDVGGRRMTRLTEVTRAGRSPKYMNFYEFAKSGPCFAKMVGWKEEAAGGSKTNKWVLFDYIGAPVNFMMFGTRRARVAAARDVLRALIAANSARWSISIERKNVYAREDGSITVFGYNSCCRVVGSFRPSKKDCGVSALYMDLLYYLAFVAGVDRDSGGGAELVEGLRRGGELPMVAARCEYMAERAGDRRLERECGRLAAGGGAGGGSGSGKNNKSERVVSVSPDTYFPLSVVAAVFSDKKRVLPLLDDDVLVGLYDACNFTPAGEKKMLAFLDSVLAAEQKK